MRTKTKIKVIFSILFLFSVLTQASTAPKCSAVLMFQKSEVEAKVTAIVKTILTHQMKIEQGLQGNPNAVQEASRQINEIVKSYPEMLQFYNSEMTRLSKKDSLIQREVKTVGEKEKSLDQKVVIEDSVVVINIDHMPQFIFKKMDGSYFVIGRNKEFIDFFNQQKDIQQVLANKSNEAIAILKKDGTVFTWGDKDNGGDSSGLDLTNVKAIYSTGSAFAALKADGSVLSWGSKGNGGDSSGHDLTNVKAIYSTRTAFAALKNDGSVVTWGDKDYGGVSSGHDLTNVKAIYSTEYAFAALKTDGTVLTWGRKNRGGDSSGHDLTNVKAIYSTEYAFAALKTDGSVLSWGAKSMGGDSSGHDLTNVKAIYSTEYAFAALKKDGTVVTWGDQYYGADSFQVQNQLYDIVQIIEVKFERFLALRKDGKYVLWGKPIGDYQNQVLDFDLF